MESQKIRIQDSQVHESLRIQILPDSIMNFLHSQNSLDSLLNNIVESMRILEILGTRYYEDPRIHDANPDF